jgi:hypothetical protein
MDQPFFVAVLPLLFIKVAPFLLKHGCSKCVCKFIVHEYPLNLLDFQRLRYANGAQNPHTRFHFMNTPTLSTALIDLSMTEFIKDNEWAPMQKFHFSQ